MRCPDSWVTGRRGQGAGMGQLSARCGDGAPGSAAGGGPAARRTGISCISETLCCALLNATTRIVSRTVLWANNLIHWAKWRVAPSTSASSAIRALLHEPRRSGRCARCTAHTSGHSAAANMPGIAHSRQPCAREGQAAGDTRGPGKAQGGEEKTVRPRGWTYEPCGVGV